MTEENISEENISDAQIEMIMKVFNIDKEKDAKDFIINTFN